jgi:hypothetical protein
MTKARYSFVCGLEIKQIAVERFSFPPVHSSKKNMIARRQKRRRTRIANSDRVFNEQAIWGDPDGLLVFCCRVPGAMRHFRDAEHRGHAASQNRDRTKHRTVMGMTENCARYGPGSAAHRSAKCYALRCVRGTERACHSGSKLSPPAPPARSTRGCDGRAQVRARPSASGSP